MILYDNDIKISLCSVKLTEVESSKISILLMLGLKQVPITST